MHETTVHQPILSHDLWIDHGSPFDGDAQIYVAFVYAKQGFARQRSANIFLSLKNGLILFGCLRFSDERLAIAIQKLASFLETLNWCEMPESILTARIEDSLGFYLELLNKAPENWNSWCPQEWTQQRLVEVSQAHKDFTLSKIREIVEIELSNYRKSILGVITSFTQNRICNVGELKEKLPQFSWYQIHNYLVNGNPVVVRNRLQALTVFPSLSGLVFEKTVVTKFSEGLRQTIDSGAPLIDFIVDQWKVRPCAVKSLRGVGCDWLGDHWMQSMRTLVSILNAIAPEKTPKSPEQWRVFGRQAGRFSSLVKKPLGSETVKLLMVKVSQKNWCASEELTVEAIEEIRVLELFSGDLVRALYIWILRDVGRRADMPSESDIYQQVSSAFISYGLEKSIKLALAWRSSTATVSGLNEGSVPEFPLLLEQPWKYSGIVIVQLRNHVELEQESEVMKHCVNTYQSACKSGKSVICSIRSEDGVRFSTFELAIVSSTINSYEPKLIEHKSHGNASAPSVSVEALRYFMGFLKGVEGQACLKRFTQNRWLANLDSKLSNDYQMAIKMSDFIELKSGDRLGFGEYLNKWRAMA